MPPQPASEGAPRQASDVMAFGQETGRALSDGRIVGRAEPFAKVFPSSRAVKRAVGLVAWAVLEDIGLDARIDDAGRLVAETNVRRIAANLGVSKNTVTQHLATLRDYGFVLREELRDDVSGRYEVSRYVLDPSACIERFTLTPGGERPAGERDDVVDAPGPSTLASGASDGEDAQTQRRSGGPGVVAEPATNGAAADAQPPRPRNQDTAVNPAGSIGDSWG